MLNENIHDMLSESLVKYFEKTINSNWDIKALSNYKGESFTNSEVAHYILRFHTLFEESGVKKGDKIALLGKNSARWCIAYLSVITYGAVIVPILPDFKPSDTQNIINHSDSIILFSGDGLFENLDFNALKNINTVISLADFNIVYQKEPDSVKTLKDLEEKFKKKYSAILTKGLVKFPPIQNSDLAVISYTSGTTGFSKGVMLSHNSLTANVRFAQKHMPLNPGDPIVSFLPLAHTYGAAFEFMYPFSIGCHVTILTKTPSPQIITQAFQEIRPALILSVPLVIEKIYKKQIIPAVEKPLMKKLLKVPFINKLIYKKINKKLTKVFGGNFREVVIGGAPLNIEAEEFFKKIKFKYTVGYGMTECGPLISYDSWKKNKLGSSGISVDTLTVKIDSPDPANIVGEIMVKGENVMEGYYKNEKATKDIIDDDGWLHTGDLGVIDKDGHIFIKGRSKSLLLSANGKNVYPEELEAAINNKFGISESLVVQRGGKFVALVYPDFDTIQANNISEDELIKIFEGHRKKINEEVPSYMNISKIEVLREEFAKTPKRSIKRYLYN